MKRPFSILIALCLAVTAGGCAEQPGKKKEEDSKDGKVETKAVDSGGAKSDAKPAAEAAK